MNAVGRPPSGCSAGSSNSPSLVHAATVAASLAVLLRVELEVDVAVRLRTLGIAAADEHRADLAALGVDFVPEPNLSRSWKPASDLRAFVGIWRSFRRLKPEIVHTHTPKAGVLGRAAARLAGVPVVVNTCHGLWATSGDSWAKRAAVASAESLAALFSDAELYQNP